MSVLLAVVLVLLLIGVVPRWKHSRDWGYAPSGAVGLAAIVVILLVALGRI